MTELEREAMEKARSDLEVKLARARSAVALQRAKLDNDAAIHRLIHELRLQIGILEENVLSTEDAGKVQSALRESMGVVDLLSNDLRVVEEQIAQLP